MMCHPAMLQHTYEKQATDHIVIASTLPSHVHQLQWDIAGEAKPSNSSIIVVKGKYYFSGLITNLVNLNGQAI